MRNVDMFSFITDPYFGLICRCFLLTPKLLPNLEYSNACSILNVMNGPWIEQPAKGFLSNIPSIPNYMLILSAHTNQLFIN